MDSLKRFLDHPQRLWLRKALFQIHLWTSIAFGLYLLMMSVTGAVLIYRRDLQRKFQREPAIAVSAAPRLTSDELQRIAKRDYPGYTVDEFFKRRDPSRPVEIWLVSGNKKVYRFFNPFTGADLGDSGQARVRKLDWLVDLHDNLLLGHAGQEVNALGGIVLTAICVTGLVIWWPGRANWRRSIGVDWKTNPKRLNWTLHSVLGFWCLAFIFMFGFTGIYLSVPGPFNAIVGLFDPAYGSSRRLSWGDWFLYWLAQLHIGRFGGLKIEIAWTVLGLVPAALFVTGTIMWWNRVLKPGLRRRQHTQALLAQVESETVSSR